MKRDGEAVDGFRVGCLVAEEALKVSLRPSVGTTGLTTRLLGQTVKMNLDGYRNQQYVKVHEAERELAVRIAKRVRVEINRLGFEMKDAVVPSKDAKPDEEHDMVLEMVDVPDEGMFMKKVSGEFTCRRMRSKAGLDVVREKLQKERVDEKSWWQREASTGQWEGRLVVLCNFPTGASGSFDSYADYTPVGGKPRGVLNWPYARRSFKRNADVMRLPAPPPAPPPVVQAAKAKARPAPVRVSSPVRRRKDPYPQLQFRQWKGRTVAPIKAVLKAAKADTDHIERRYQRWASNVPNGFADRTPRFRVKRMGWAFWESGCGTFAEPRWVSRNPQGVRGISAETTPQNTHPLRFIFTGQAPRKVARKSMLPQRQCSAGFMTMSDRDIMRIPCE